MGVDQVEVLMQSMHLEKSTGALLELVDNIPDICVLTLEDMEARGIKVSIRFTQSCPESTIHGPGRCRGLALSSVD